VEVIELIEQFDVLSHSFLKLESWLARHRVQGGPLHVRKPPSVIRRGGRLLDTTGC